MDVLCVITASVRFGSISNVLCPWEMLESLHRCGNNSFHLNKIVS